MTDEKIFEEVIEREDVNALSKAFFDVELYEFQEELVRDIAFDKENRIAITTPSQAGKSWALAIATALYVLLHEDKTVLIISSTRDQAKLIRDKFAQFVVESEALFEILEDSGVSSEVSKRKMDFTNGCTVKTLSASGQNEGQSLMGHGLEGGGVILLDEANLIPDTILEKRVLRMLGSAPDSTLVKIGNPTQRNHFYQSLKKDPDFKQMQVTGEDAVKQGTFTQHYVDEMKDKMSDRAFRINIMAKFPDADANNTLMKWNWLEKADRKTFAWKSESSDRVMYGLDVARQGDDSSVLSRVEVKNGEYRVTDQWKWDLDDTTPLVKNVSKIMDARNENHINVDTHGVGAGVMDRLREKGYFAVGIKVGKGAENKDMFLRQKAENYWKLRRILEDGDMAFSFENTKELIRELDDLDISYNAREKVRIDGPDNYSPDFADSLMLAVAYEKGAGSVLETGSTDPIL